MKRKLAGKKIRVERKFSRAASEIIPNKKLASAAGVRYKLANEHQTPASIRRIFSRQQY
jgi:hypothetical protein